MTNRIIIYLLLMCAVCQMTTAKSYTNLYQKLAEVNVQWHKQTDVPQEVFTKAPVLEEIAAIQTHLKYVEQTLRQRNVSHLTENQRKNRQIALNELNGYWQKGQFPKNVYLPYRNPVFIDKFNTFCAVGYLVKATGFEPISRQIAENQNFKYVYEIKSEALLDWAKEYGFSLAELAWIQPGYPPTQPTNAMQMGVGGPVKDIIPGIFGTDEIHVVGTFSSGVSAYFSGVAGYDWFAEAQVVGEVNAIEFYNNYPVIAGNLTSVNTMPVSNVIQLAPNGSGIQQMGTLESTVYDLEYYKNELYAAGNFGVKKWDGTAWVSILTTDGTVQKLHVFNNDLYVGGAFNTVNGQTQNNITKFDGTNVIAMDNGVDFSVYAINHLQNEIYIGGDFIGVGPGNPPLDTGYVWYFTNNQWRTTQVPLIGSAIYSFENVEDVNLYVGGDFSYQPMMGTYGSNLVKMQKWGTNYSCEGMDLLNQAVYALRFHNKRLYIGGAFTAGMNNNLNGIGYIEDNTVSIELPKNEAFMIYPNPVQGKLEIQVKGGYLENTSLYLYDLAGKLLMESKISSAVQQGISVAHLPSGMYSLQIGKETHKFVKL
ncbi:MAG: T9SS type A sorting domain-containing protein [Bacteroidia bacterium]